MDTRKYEIKRKELKIVSATVKAYTEKEKR